MSEERSGPGGSLLASVFLISLAALALQVLQMRIFAFALWHHLAFLVISIAILGFGAAGALTASLAWLRPARVHDAVAWAGVGFALTAVSGIWILARSPIDVFAQFGAGEVLQVGLYYLVFALPYFFAGYLISLVLARESQSVPTVYFVNLIGSGAGCFLIFATLSPLGAEGSLLAIASLGGLVCLLCAHRGLLRAAGAVLALVLLVGVPASSSLLQIQPARSKFMTQIERHPQSARKFSRWTPLSRIDVVALPGQPWWWVFQDGDAPTNLPRNANFAPNDPRAVPYNFLDQPRVLIIGSGGGNDILAALQHGAESITAVEINPATFRLSQDREFSNAVRFFDDDKVEIHNAEGRFFVRSSDRQYDLIQMTGVDTYTALASGAYVLSESYLYTEEAFHDYLDHLGPTGLLAIHRFAFPAPRETLRIMVMATEVLADRGVAEPWRHVVVLRPGQGEDGPFASATSAGTILIKKAPFREDELARIRDFATRFGLIRDYVPGDPGRFSERELQLLQRLVKKQLTLRDYRVSEDGMNPFHAYAQAMREGSAEQFLAQYPYDVRPVVDDSPYFFNQHRLSAVWGWLLGRTQSAVSTQRVPWSAMSFLFQARPLGLMLLFLTAVQLAVLAALCIFLPLLAFGRRGERRAGTAPIVGYFACLGLAYIFLQITAMQRFGLILGHPTYAISIAMASFLVSSGIGSLVSGRFLLERGPRLVSFVALGILVSAGLYHLFLPGITHAVLSASFATRCAVTVALIAPLGFLMGTCFPTGIRLVAERGEAIVAWSYGVNGAMSVLGSVIAVWLAIGLGFVAVHWIAAALYVLAAILLWRIAALRPDAAAR